MAAFISLDNVVFFTPPSATGQKPASRRQVPLVPDKAPSQASSGVRQPLQQATQDPKRAAGSSENNAVLIPSDSDSDDEDGRPDTSLPSIEELIRAAGRHRVTTGNAASSGMCPTSPTDWPTQASLGSRADTPVADEKLGASHRSDSEPSHGAEPSIIGGDFEDENQHENQHEN